MNFSASRRRFWLLVSTTLAFPQERSKAQANEKPAEGHACRYVETIEALRKLTRCEGIVLVSGHREPSDGGGGAFYWSPTNKGDDDGGILIASTRKGDGRWVRQYSGPIDVRWFGACATGLSDASDGIRAALAFAASQPVIPDIYVPAGKYLIFSEIVISKPFRRIFGEGELISRILDFSKITRATPRDTTQASDTHPGHLKGCCFYFVTNVYHGAIEGLSFVDFRFALAWFEAHNSASVIGCRFECCNVGAIFYQGCQTTKFIDCALVRTNVFVVASSTCFPRESPLSYRDNYYCDGLTISNSSRNRRYYVDVNHEFDEWFIDSILRPDVLSYTAGHKNGYIYPHTREDSASCPSGRLIYAAFRNPRLCFNIVIRDIDLGAAWRGLACVNTTITQGIIQNITSEAMWGGAPQRFDGDVLLLFKDDKFDGPGNTMINVVIGIDYPFRRIISTADGTPPGNWVLINCWTKSASNPNQIAGSLAVDGAGLRKL